jgi:predicted dehydrogenase
MFRRRCAAPAWGGWLNDPAQSGGGAFDLLIHDVDMCLHLFGVPEAVSATGYADASAGIDAIDATLYYAGGLTAVVTGGWFLAGKFPFSMEFAVTMDGATVDYSSMGRPLTVYPMKGEADVKQLPQADGYTGEIEYFASCCRDGLQPELCPPRESAQAVKLMRLMLEARDRKGERLACRI